MVSPASVKPAGKQASARGGDGAKLPAVVVGFVVVFVAFVVTTGVSWLFTDTFFFGHDREMDDWVLGQIDEWHKWSTPLMRQARDQLRRTLRLERQFTAEELDKYSGLDPSLPVYLSIHRKVFDVTAGRAYYARDSGSYGTFGGRDATRAFITGEFDLDLTCDLTGISEAAVQENMKSWLSFYENHEKYFQVGVLAYDYECPKAQIKEELKDESSASSNDNEDDTGNPNSAVDGKPGSENENSQNVVDRTNTTREHEKVEL